MVLGHLIGGEGLLGSVRRPGIWILITLRTPPFLLPPLFSLDQVTSDDTTGNGNSPLLESGCLGATKVSIQWGSGSCHNPPLIL